MSIHPRIACLLVLMSLLSACSTPATDPRKRSGYDKERARLAELMRGKRVAVTGVDRSSNNECQALMSQQTFESEIAAWGVSPVKWNQRLPTDVSISYGWTCDSSLTSAGKATIVGTVLSLGVMPTLYMQHVKLDVRVDRNGKTIFRSSYADQREVADNVWATNAGQRRLDMAGVLIEKFVKDVERDGALE